MPPLPRARRRLTRALVRLGCGALAAGAAGCLSVAIPLSGLAPLPADAVAVVAAAQRAGAQQPGTPPVSVVISSVTPGYASPGQALTIRGTVTNASAVPVRGLSIQLSSSAQGFASRDALQAYAAGSGVSSIADTEVPGATAAIRHALAPGAAARWSIRVPVRRLGLPRFGVYPLAAEAVNSIGATLDASGTFLPYWPGKGALSPLPIAWVWPLMDQPRQAACPGLVNNGLAASLGSGGRLGELLADGASYAAKAHLTWAIDPALLANAQTMTSPYQVGGNSQCNGPTKPANRAAAAWLAQLKSVTAGQPVFVTPYADVDAVALVRQGLNGDLTNAFTEGRSVAGRILGRDFSPGRGAQADDSDVLNGMAWPPGGLADYTTLQSLAGVDGISSVIMDSTTMPPLSSWPPTPSAQTTTPDGEGPDLHVLLADHTLTTILGSATASTAPGTTLAIRQYYLAETAMIAAEAPSLARSIVVVPPSRWDPPANLAKDLLAETVSAPWLHPVGVAQLAAAKSAPGQVNRKLAVPAQALSSGLRQSYLRRVRELDQRVQLLRGIQVDQDPALGYAIASAESAAWQGGGAASHAGEELTESLSSYLSAQDSGLTLISPGRVTLGGLKGSVPVSISSHLSYPIRVRLQVSVPRDGTLSVHNPPGIVRVASDTVMTIKLAVSSAAVGSTTLRLSLLTPTGAALPDQPVIMTVQATHYGTLALVIIAAALGVFLLTSGARALRRRRAAARTPATSGPEAAAPGLQTGPQQKADNVESGRGESRGTAVSDAPEDADEYARAPGRADGH